MGDVIHKNTLLRCGQHFADLIALFLLVLAIYYHSSYQSDERI